MDRLSATKFIALLSLRVDLGRPRRIPDPLPKAKAIVISDWPRKNAQLLLRLMRALGGRDEVFSLRDVEGMNHETLSVAMALAAAGIHGSYSRSQWQAHTRVTERAVRSLKKR
jgi:hypothetical protein